MDDDERRGKPDHSLSLSYSLSLSLSCFLSDSLSEGCGEPQPVAAFVIGKKKARQILLFAEERKGRKRNKEDDGSQAARATEAVDASLGNMEEGEGENEDKGEEEEEETDENVPCLGKVKKSVLPRDIDESNETARLV